MRAGLVVLMLVACGDGDRFAKIEKRQAEVVDVTNDVERAVRRIASDIESIQIELSSLRTKLDDLETKVTGPSGISYDVSSLKREVDTIGGRVRSMSIYR